MAYEEIKHYANHVLTPFLHGMGVLENLGIVKIGVNDNITRTGDFIHIPKIDPLAAFTRRDISTENQTRSFTEMGSRLETGVILHDDEAMSTLQMQEKRTGASFYMAWATQIGLWWARRAKQQLYRVAKAAIEAADTTDGSTASANIHILDEYNATTKAAMTVARLLAGKNKMGDAAGMMTVAIMHSGAFAALQTDELNTYQFENVAGKVIGLGGLSGTQVEQGLGFVRVMRSELLGMTIVVDDDIGVIDMTAATYVYDDKYETLLFGPEALYLGYQKELTLSRWDDGDDARGTTNKMRAEVDYVAHLFGIEWSSGTKNPTDTQLGTKSNYDETYKNHKEVRCVKLITN